MEFDGEVKYHQQDGYPDKTEKRRIEENEHVVQAKRYARWYVYRERGYETLTPSNNPDRLAGALIALTRYPTEEFAAAFADLETQLRSHFDESETVELPFDDVDPSGPVVYQKDVFVDPDPTEFDPPVLERLTEGIDGPTLQAVLDSGRVTEDQPSIPDITVDDVSPMYTVYHDGPNSKRVSRTDSPTEDPDATVEMVPSDPDAGVFQHLVVSNLAYQIRDRFVLMGLEPPALFQATGWGQYDAMLAQEIAPQYDSYWDADASVSSWQPW